MPVVASRTGSPTTKRAKASTAHPNTLYHLKDDETGRKYTVEYLSGSSGKYGRVRGRVALSCTDLPPSMRTLPRPRPDGGYEHVYERKLNLKNLTDDTKSSWYQPMFKQRWTREDEHGNKMKGVDWYSCLGSYWDPKVAAVAAEIAKQRHADGQDREAIERVEEDLLQAARDYCGALQRKGKSTKRIVR